MPKTFSLNQNHRSQTTAVQEKSVLTCNSVSNDQVFTRGIVDNAHQTDLRPGESMSVPDGSTLVVRIFSNDPSARAFSAELVLTP